MILTLAIPFHAHPHYLEKALRSVVAQTSPDWICLVCDDSKTQLARSVVAGFSDPRIRYLTNPNPGGMVGNWNFCFERAETPLLTLLHGDDELGPDYVKNMIAAAERYPLASAFYCRSEIIDENGRRKFSFPDWIKLWLEPRSAEPTTLSGETGAARLLRGNFIMCPTLCYRRRDFSEARFSPRFAMVQDLDFILRLLQRGGEIVGLKQTSFRYRRHAQNATSEMTANLRRFEEENALYENYAQEFSTRGWLRAARIAKRKRILKLHVLYLLAQAVGRGKFSRVRALRSFYTTRLLA